MHSSVKLLAVVVRGIVLHYCNTATVLIVLVWYFRTGIVGQVVVAVAVAVVVVVVVGAVQYSSSRCTVVVVVW